MNKTVFVASKNALPLGALPWEDFETLCLELATKKYGEPARKYLDIGNKQEGIDIYVRDSTTKQNITIQCKRRQAFTVADLKKAVQSFLDGEYKDKTQEFILATTFDISSKALEAEKQKLETKLDLLKIKFTLWDYRGLNQLLKEYPQIVYNAFDSEDVVAKFNGRLELTKLQLRKPQPSKIQYSKPLVYFERRIYSIEEEEKALHPYWRNESTFSTLIQTIENGKTESTDSIKILLLSGAGFGKSSELENLANHYCNSDQKLFPIKIELKNYVNERIEDLISQKCKDWQNIKYENLLVILDGLDEIEDSKISDVFRLINQFSTDSLFKKINLVISSRTNFYDKDSVAASLRGFRIFLLDSLRAGEVREFSKTLLKKDTTTFWNLISNRKFEDLVLHPFYFILLAEIYNEKGVKDFPQKRTEIFEKLIEIRIEKEKAKFCLKYPDFSIDVPLIKSLVTKVAFSMEQLGKNLIKDEELKQLFPDSKERKLLKYFFLINKRVSQEISWQFDHNNFQEYLASKVLSRYNFKKIKELVAFRPDFSFIKPKWLNTLSFLFSIEDANSAKFKQLLKWIVDNSPEVLIRFEKDKLQDNLRYTIFKGIYNSYKAKQLYIRSEYFSIKELANFSGKDKKWLSFILDEINKSTGDDVLYSLYNLLECAENLYKLENKIIETLLRIIESKDFVSSHQRDAIDCITVLNIGSENLLEQIISQCPNADDFEVRSAIYPLIYKLNLSKKYMNYCLDGIPILIQKTKGSSYHGAGMSLEKVLLNDETADGYKRIYRYIFENPDILGHEASFGEYQFDNDFIRQLMAKTATIYKTDSSVLDCVIELFILISEKHYLRDYSSIHDFFSATNTQLILTKKLFERDILNSLYVDEYYRVLNWESLEFISSKYKQDKISAMKIWNIIHSLNTTETKAIYERFYNHMNKVSGGKIKYATDNSNYNWDEIAKAQELKNQKLLLNKKLFFKEVTSFFNKVGKDSLTWEDITEFRHKNRTAEAVHENRIVIDLLRDFALNKQCNIKHINKIYSPQKNWDWYVRSQVCRKLNNKVELTKELKENVISWCLSKIGEANFAEAVFKKEGDDVNQFSYNTMERDLAFFFLKLNIDYPKEAMLEMFNMDWSGIKRNETSKEILSDLLITKINDNDSVSAKVLQQLESGIKIRVVLNTYVRLCKELAIGNSIKYLFVELKENTLDMYDKVECSDIYIALGGGVEDLEELTPKHYTGEINYWHWYLLNHLVNYKPIEAKRVLLNILASDTIREEDKDTAAEKLISLGFIEGLDYLYKWIISHDERPRWHSTSKYMFKDLPLKPATDIFIKLIEHSYTAYPTKDVIFPGAVDIGILGVNSLGTISEKNLIYIENRIVGVIKKLKKKYPKATYLYNQIDNIKKEYHLLNEGITIAEVIKVNNTVDFLLVN